MIKEVDEKGRLNNKLNGDTRKRKFQVSYILNTYYIFLY